MEESDIWHPSYDELVQATDNFSPSNLLGKGGFGEVYKGQLKGTLVAIKRLQAGGQPGEFETEVEVLSQLRHPNIVLLMGCAPESLCMISEYMPGGSLHDRLSSSSSTGPFLPWEDRLRIASEMAAALLYMHSRRVLHRDLKPANVLLDKHNVSKLADMGLAKLFPDQSAVHTGPGVKGTIGYIDPYYLQTLQLTKQYDIYALGLILLQLVTGIHKVGDLHILLEECGPSLPRRNLHNAIEIVMQHLDKSAGRWPQGLAREVVRLGLLCSEHQKDLRPSLERIVQPELQRIAGEGEKESLRRISGDDWHQANLQIDTQPSRRKNESDTDGSSPRSHLMGDAGELDGSVGMKVQLKQKDKSGSGRLQALSPSRSVHEDQHGMITNGKQKPKKGDKKDGGGSTEGVNDFIGRKLMRQWSWRSSLSRNQTASPDDKRSHGKEKNQGSQNKKSGGLHGSAPPPVSPRSPHSPTFPPNESKDQFNVKKNGCVNAPLSPKSSSIYKDTREMSQRTTEGGNNMATRLPSLHIDVERNGVRREFMYPRRDDFLGGDKDIYMVRAPSFTGSEASTPDPEDDNAAKYRRQLNIPKSRQTDGSIPLGRQRSIDSINGEQRAMLVARMLENERSWLYQKALSERASFTGNDSWQAGKDKRPGTQTGPAQFFSDPQDRILRRSNTENMRRRRPDDPLEGTPPWVPSGKLSSQQCLSLELYEVSLATGLGTGGPMGEINGKSLATTTRLCHELDERGRSPPLWEECNEREGGGSGELTVVHEFEEEESDLDNQRKSSVSGKEINGGYEDQVGDRDSDYGRSEMDSMGMKGNIHVDHSPKTGMKTGLGMLRSPTRNNVSANCFSNLSPSLCFTESRNHSSTALSASEAKRSRIPSGVTPPKSPVRSRSPSLGRSPTMPDSTRLRQEWGLHRRTSSESTQSTVSTQSTHVGEGWRSEDEFLSSTTSPSPVNGSPSRWASPMRCGSLQEQSLLVELERFKRKAEEAERARRFAEEKAQRVLAEANRSLLEVEMQYKRREMERESLFEAVKAFSVTEDGSQSVSLEANWSDTSMDYEGRAWRTDKEGYRWEVRAPEQSNFHKIREYSYDELQNATENFSISQLIRNGSSHTVYSGVLKSNGRILARVAVKMLKRWFKGENNFTFESEVNKLNRIKHPNILQPIGFCAEPCGLIYERLPGHTLEDGLGGQNDKLTLLWYKRLRIAAEVASALLELHSQKEPVVHSNLQASKVLLDWSLTAKMALPLSKENTILPGEHQSSGSLKVWGMFRHIDPEYQRTGMFTPRSDVFSFGILLLDILTGSRPEAYRGVEEAVDNSNPEQLMEVLDSRAGEWPIQLAMEVANLAVACSEMRSKRRPDLRMHVVPKMNRIRVYAKYAEESHKRQVALASFSPDGRRESIQSPVERSGKEMGERVYSPSSRASSPLAGRRGDAA